MTLRGPLEDPAADRGPRGSRARTCGSSPVASRRAAGVRGATRARSSASGGEAVIRRPPTRPDPAPRRTIRPSAASARTPSGGQPAASRPRRAAAARGGERALEAIHRRHQRGRQPSPPVAGSRSVSSRRRQPAIGDELVHDAGDGDGHEIERRGARRSRARAAAAGRAARRAGVAAPGSRAPPDGARRRPPAPPRRAPRRRRERAPGSVPDAATLRRPSSNTSAPCSSTSARVGSRRRSRARPRPRAPRAARGVMPPPRDAARRLRSRTRRPAMTSPRAGSRSTPRSPGKVAVGRARSAGSRSPSIAADPPDSGIHLVRADVERSAPEPSAGARIAARRIGRASPRGAWPIPRTRGPTVRTSPRRSSSAPAPGDVQRGPPPPWPLARPRRGPGSRGPGRPRRPARAAASRRPRAEPPRSVPVTTVPRPLTANTRSIASRQRPAIRAPARRDDASRHRAKRGPDLVDARAGRRRTRRGPARRRGSSRRAARRPRRRSTSSTRAASTMSIFVTTTSPSAIPSASRSCECSSVCGRGPSSAATTSIAASISPAPTSMLPISRSWPGHVDEVELDPVVEAPGGHSRRRSSCRGPLLGQPVGIDAGQGAQQARLAVVDVPGGADDDGRQRSLSPARSAASAARIAVGERPRPRSGSTVRRSRTTASSTIRPITAGLARPQRCRAAAGRRRSSEPSPTTAASGPAASRRRWSISSSATRREPARRRRPPRRSARARALELVDGRRDLAPDRDLAPARRRRGTARSVAASAARITLSGSHRPRQRVAAQLLDEVRAARDDPRLRPADELVAARTSRGRRRPRGARAGVGSCASPNRAVSSSAPEPRSSTTIAPCRCAAAASSAASGASTNPVCAKFEGWTRSTSLRAAVGEDLLEILDARAVRRPDLDQSRAGPPDDLRDPHAAADLDELAARDRDAAAAREPDRERDRRRVVVRDERVLGAGQRDDLVLDGAESPAAAARRRDPARASRARPPPRRAASIAAARPRRAPEVRVEDHAGRVDHGGEAGVAAVRRRRPLERREAVRAAPRQGLRADRRRPVASSRRSSATTARATATTAAAIAISSPSAAGAQHARRRSAAESARPGSEGPAGSSAGRRRLPGDEVEEMPVLRAGGGRTVGILLVERR